MARLIRELLWIVRDLVHKISPQISIPYTNFSTFAQNICKQTSLYSLTPNTTKLRTLKTFDYGTDKERSSIQGCIEKN